MSSKIGAAAGGKTATANEAKIISVETHEDRLIHKSHKERANKRLGFSQRLPRLMQRCKSSPTARLLEAIDKRFLAISHTVCSSAVFRRNQLAHALAEQCASVMLVRVQRYEGPLGCAFSGSHTRLVSVQMSRETSKQPQTLQHCAPVVMQTQMAQLVRCLCVLRTWTQLEASPHWTKGVCRSYKTLRLAAQLLPRD